MAGLEITIGGDASDFEREVRDVEKQLQTLERRREARVRVGADTGDLDRRISGVNSRLNQLRTTANNTAPAMDRLTRSTANGSNTLTQFSRIAQDAPFGIMGIGNNLTATAEAFANLRNQTGSAGGALRAVASSMLGTGGILLAVSLVTTGLTYMSQQGLTVSDVFKKMSGTFDANRKAMQDLSVETAKNAQAQISSIGAYVSAAKNINLSMDDRLIAVRKLQDEYPAYFGNLTKEQILNGNVATTVREVTAALIAKAKAAGLTDRIVKLAEEEEKIRIKINNQIYEAAKTAKLTNAQTAILAGNFKALAQNGGNFMDTVNKVGKEANIPWLVLNGTIVRVLQGFTDLGGELRNNKAQQDRLTDSLEKQTAAQIKLDAVKDKAPEKVGYTPQVSPIKVTIKPIIDLVDLNTIEMPTGEIDKFGNKIKELPNVIKTGMDKAKNAFDMSGVAMLESLQKFNDEANAIIQDSLVGTFNNLGTAIGDALASGENIFSAIGKSLLGSLGAFISDMGSLLIKYGTLAVAKGVLDQAIATGGPFAVAAGIAAIGVGVALKAAGSAISAKAKGGASSAETGASYSSPSQSTINSGSSSFGGGNVVFEIRGTTLIGVLNNTLDQNRRLGGNLPIG